MLFVFYGVLYDGDSEESILTGSICGYVFLWLETNSENMSEHVSRHVSFRLARLYSGCGFEVKKIRSCQARGFDHTYRIIGVLFGGKNQLRSIKSGQGYFGRFSLLVDVVCASNIGFL